MFRRPLVLVLLFLFAATGLTFAADPPAEQYTLPNGLTVILAPMPAAQRVAIVTGYQVGSADEPKGRSGFAHLFEHLMFEGTTAVPDYDAMIAALGADTNAFTEYDATTYYAVGQPKNLAKLLRLEADRMANLANAVTQADLDNQRDIVKNEMRQNTLDQPGAAARLQAMTALVGADHPYGHATIGSVADLDAATVADVQAFHRTYYVPSNAIVAITGKFDLAQARDIVEKTFGLVPARKAPPKVSGEPRLAAPVRLEFKDAVDQPTLLMMFNGPKDNTPEDLAAMMAYMVLSSDSGPLYSKLVHRDGIATAAGGYWDSRRLGGTFMFYGRAASGVDAAKLEAGLLAALKEAETEGLDKDQMQAAIASLNSHFDSTVADPHSYAMLLLAAAASTGDATSWRDQLEQASRITPEEALKVLRQIIATPAVTVIINPGARNTELPPVVAQSTGSAEPLAAAAHDDVVIPDLPELSSEAVVFPKPQAFTLANGMKMNVYSSADTSTTAMALVFPRGSTVTNGARKGLAELATDLRSRGAGTMTMAEMSLALDRAGARIGSDTTDHATMFTAAAPSKNLTKLTELFHLALTQPRFDATEWKTQIEQKAQSIEQRLRDPSNIANRAAAIAAFPKGAAEGEVSDPAKIRGFAMADAQAVFQQMLVPGEARLEVVTALAPEDVQKIVAPLLGAWTDGAETALDIPPWQRPIFGNREIIEHVPGATQAAIVMEFAAAEPFTPEAIASDVAMQIIGGGSSGRLYRALREDKGWSYGIYGGISGGEKNGGNALGYISTSVQADRTRDALAEIRRVLNAVTKEPITAVELNAALQDIRNQYAAVLETADGLLSTVAWSVLSGFELIDVERKLALFEAVKLGDVQKQAEAIAKREMITVIAGDTATMK